MIGLLELAETLTISTYNASWYHYQQHHRHRQHCAIVVVVMVMVLCNVIVAPQIIQLQLVEMDHTHTTTIMKYTQKELVGKVTLLLVPPLQQLHHHLTQWTRSAEQQ